MINIYEMGANQGSVHLVHAHGWQEKRSTRKGGGPLTSARPGLAARTSHAAGFFGFGFDKEAMPTPVRPKMPKWQERHLRATWSL